MFTPSIKSTDFFNGEIRVEVEFLQDSEGAQPFVETFRPRSKEQLDALIRNRVNELEKMEAFVESITTGQYVPEPLPEPSVPTQEQLDKDLWLSKWRDYQGAKRAIKELTDAGFTPTSEEQTEFDTLKNWLATHRKKEYSKFL